MDAETWMNANMAVELGFADGFIERSADKKSEEDDKSDEDTDEETEEDNDSDDDDTDEEDNDEKKSKEKTSSFLFSRTAVNRALQNKLERHYRKPENIGGTQAEIPAQNNKHTVDEIISRLDTIKKFI